ncbi:hypothetical protein SBI_08529 [Streptomyces bingchenggensis BCW-1]|uniref:Uncharacterized protein n=1 Tax=Streptomyces bingchenggensis (strain BCW-1) TaxID=749414 RepID=D7BU98_STRBB|nr:hypothetical protein SBI_08529 [Streptomyces bingchenggensis BCW-1]
MPESQNEDGEATVSGVLMHTRQERGQDVRRTHAEASPTQWVQDSGASISAVLLAWEHGKLAELPVGTAWDVVRLEQPAGWEAIRLLQKMGLPLGPVLYAHLAVEIPVPVHAADGWDLHGATVLGAGETLLVPHARIVAPHTQHGRSWIIPPNHQRLLTDPDDLYGAYFAALAKAAEQRGLRR